MNLLIAGASGFVGRHLVNALQTTHTITVLGRDRTLLERLFPASVKLCTWQSLEGLDANNYDVVINLCGHNIGASRWNKEIKQQLIDSRVKTSTNLINWAINYHAKPHFYCANAVGIYGMQKNGDAHVFDEDSVIDFNHPRDFLSEIGIRWQQAMQPALNHGMKVTITRFGVILEKGEGMLKKLGPSFYFGLGAVIGDGRQVISWVHIDDVVSAFLFLLHNEELTGIFNFTAPLPVSQAQFARTLAKAMHRPLLFKIPAFIIRGLFGEMGECLLLNGQRVVPKRLIEEGYQFHYPELTSALTKEFR
ncbi:TIGR01777 family oxidoreductase [Legionella fairfieldensis]|uniref:TIGR01777 family oxidoreductase n=1 Tax=Legionella fairfieldensis TaxID=45064 RepID=UPI00048E3B82|nr:TIGR01777 family oxidoreductase [Legionella fairfieldensis]